MRLADLTSKILGLTEAMRRWQTLLDDMDERRREKVARYAEEIAGTLARAATAYQHLERSPKNKSAQRSVLREFARLSGYVENILETLEGRIDGRRLAGIKRRLEGIALEGLVTDSLRRADATRIDRLVAAEGYFRALADSLRT